MLRSFNKHFNETVFRGPDVEGAGGDVIDDNVTGGNDDGGSLEGDAGDDDGGSTEPLTVREQIKKSIAETSEPEPKTKKDPKGGRFGERQAKPEGEPAAPKEGEPTAAPAIAAPEALSKEAKAEWAKTPPAVQAAIVKREQDMAQGVEQLKQRYTLIDQALAPHTDALRQMNATPADAVNRMFLWFKALAGAPKDAFPALAQSMGIDFTKLFTPQAGAADQTAAQGTGSGTAPEIPDQVKQYVGNLENQVQQLTQYVQQIGGQFGSMQQNVNAQNEAKTRENLTLWSGGKPYFEEVRQDMAKLIETGVVPLKADGQVDLDTAYERAIYFNPEVRAKVLAEQQQANGQAQQQVTDAATTARQTQVSKARKASVSLSASTTPGAANGQQFATKKKAGEKLSVRDSLKASIAQLRDQ